MVQQVFESFYVYGAVAPTSGEHFFMELPALNAENFQLFVDTFGKSYPDTLNLLLVDNSGAHTAKKLRMPENVRLVFLPPYCPELNPIERFWRDLKDELAWKQFGTLELLREAVATLLCAYADQTVKSLTGYSYLLNAFYALSS